MTPRFFAGSRLFAAPRRSTPTFGVALAVAITVGLVAATAGARPASAQAPTPAEVADYLGTWTLSATFQGTPAELTLEIVERQGAVRAALRTAMTPEPQM